MPKKDRIRSFSYRNGSVEYSNRSSSVYIKDKIAIRTEAWECPDGSGFWFVTSKCIKDDSEAIHRIKIDHDGNVIEETRE